MKKPFSELDPVKRVSIILIAITVIVFAALLPFAFFDRPGYSFGWLLGNAISLIAYLSIVFGSKALLSAGGAKGLSLGLTVFFSMIRFALYGTGLLFGALCTFYWGNPWLNFWTVFAGYTVMPIIVAANHFYELKKSSSEPIPAKKEESKPEEKEGGENE